MSTNEMDFASDSEQSDAESNVSLTVDIVEVECEAEFCEDLATDHSDPEGPYMDEPLADDNWLENYNQEVEDADRRNQILQNRFDGSERLETW